MRNLEECKAEVFRRSEKRIKERKKKRKQILTGLVPFCFCLVLLSAVNLPMIVITNHKNTGAVEQCDINTPCSGTKNRADVIVKTQDADQPLTDKAEQKTTDQLFDIIQDAFRTKDSNTYSQKSEQIFGDQAMADRLLHPEAQTFTLITPEGTQVVYMLIGNKLIDKSKNQEIILTDDQQTELQKLLVQIKDEEENEK
ncbi:MAG: hypothetical protein HFE78_01235 [Clostridiales bacterium]|nr:hypothetical protein [Clostridiales bacterium]